MNVAKHWYGAGEVFAISDCLVVLVGISLLSVQAWDTFRIIMWTHIILPKPIITSLVLFSCDNYLSLPRLLAVVHMCLLWAYDFHRATGSFIVFVIINEERGGGGG